MCPWMSWESLLLHNEVRGPSPFVMIYGREILSSLCVCDSVCLYPALFRRT